MVPVTAECWGREGAGRGAGAARARRGTTSCTASSAATISPSLCLASGSRFSRTVPAVLTQEVLPLANTNGRCLHVILELMQLEHDCD